MLLRFDLPFQLPGLNDLLDHKSRMYRKHAGNHSVANAYNDMKGRYAADIGWTVRKAYGSVVPKIPQHAVTSMRFDWREPDTRRDPDNIAAAGTKLILDSLQAMGVIATDGWSLFDDPEAGPVFLHSFSVDPKRVGVAVSIHFRNVPA